MLDDFNSFSIASVAYHSGITDRSLLELIKRKTNFNVESQSSSISHYKKNKVNFDTTRRTVSKRTSSFSRNKEKVWASNKDFPDTSTLYRRPYKHMGLWTRISRNSCGTLPNEINFLSREQIKSTDDTTIKSYLTDSGGIRKCCLSVFARCAYMAAWSIGCIENFKKCPYSCKPIITSVLELSKNTNAGTDTMGRKNDPAVQRRIISQVKDVFKKPTSFKLFKNNVKLFEESTLKNLYDLPESIFHRFQATYDQKLNKSQEKSRIVWCVPYTVVAIENIFFGNIIDSTKLYAMKSTKAIYPIGLTNFQIGSKSVGTLRDEFKRVGKGRLKIYSLDFSKFDSTIPNWFKDIFFSLFAPLINFVDSNYLKVYDYLRVYIKYTPFINKNLISIKLKGISSGLLITNLYDTLWNMTLHYFVKVLKESFPEQTDYIYRNNPGTVNDLKFDTKDIMENATFTEPSVRVMGDDSIILCDEFTLFLHRKVCAMLGMKVTIKHITEDPYDDIFFLGRYWNKNNQPFQTENYMALRICYTKWFDDKSIPFPLKELHLNRILSICLPLIGGKEFLDKYLFDYPLYKNFKNSEKGFIYMKEFIEENFKFIDYQDAFDVDSY